MKKYKHSLVKFVTVSALMLNMFGASGILVHADTINNTQENINNNQENQKESQNRKLDNNSDNDINRVTPVKHSTSRVNAKLNRIVSLAKRQVGKRYVWGATGPNAFDCSGLAQYVYLHGAGRNISRTTYTQVHRGHRVSMRHLRKGDLLFWGSISAPYHVGIYIGHGQYVHAATPRQGVRRQHLSRYFYPSQAKRIL